ncbi:MAG TPA: cyclic pyranopterin monophosphate synthase MoaC, partial [Thermoanaerobaculia bacterium]|nr:cyclic pyranopterin monophosphate synthase MoaC [Thermoanaerobaculia bacterium]
MTSGGPFTHLDPQGGAHMVDVSEKPITRRVAEASCRVLLSAQTVIRLANLPKGDAFAVSRLAGIQGAKRTSELIPLAHPLPLDQVEVDVLPAPDGVEIRSRVLVTARTGAEMEALV